MAIFNPEDDPKAFRAALSCFATGVTVITALENGIPIGITANSFASLSLDPALVLWSPAKSSGRHDAFVAADAFNVHILAEDQKAICDAFIRDRHGFTGLAQSPNAAGIPVLDGCLAVFECRKHILHDAGDHTLILGQVMQAFACAGAPLLFFNGQFQTHSEK